jgi:hypothetical protein
MDVSGCNAEWTSQRVSASELTSNAVFVTRPVDTGEMTGSYWETTGSC